MQLRAKQQESERKKRLLRMKREKERKAKAVCDRLFNHRNLP